MTKPLWPLAAALSLLLVCCCFAMAQQSGPDAIAPNGMPAESPPPPIPPENPRPSVEELRPWVYYLPDKEGKLQPVLDFQYQDFVDLYHLKNRLGRSEEPPRYSIQNIQATGTAIRNHADLQMRFQVLVRDDEWVRIPLRLNQAMLAGPAQHEGEGEHFVYRQPDDGGYVCWLRGKAGARHVVALKLIVPLTPVGDESRLKLFMPRATESELQMSVPGSDMVATVSDDGLLISTTPGQGDTTEFRVVGLGGEFQIAWRRPNPPTAQSPLVLESTGTILARLESASIRTEAVLSVRSYGAAFDRFIVRLPPGAELEPGNPDGYTIAPVEPAAGENASSRLYEVQTTQKTFGPIEVRLGCRRPYDPTNDPSWCELAGFEVIGAARQSGVIAVGAPEDWQVLWGDSGNVRHSAQLPESLRKSDVVASFDYSTYPYSLTARLTPRKTRISVDPQYVLFVDRDSVRLEGKLAYSIRGLKTATLQVALPGWELDEVGPDTVVAVDGVAVEKQTVAIPLTQPTSGSLEIFIRAHQPISADAKSIALSLPHPQAGLPGPCSVIVAPADNVELTPLPDAIQGLIRQRIAPPLKSTERRQDPLCYRGTGGTALFAADFRVHPQRITVHSATQVDFGERTAEVQQRQTYSVAYEPIDRLAVAIPRALAGLKPMHIFLDGKPIEPTAAVEEPAAGNPASPTLMRITLPSPRIGACELLLQYAVPLPQLSAEKAVSFALPLPTPKIGEVASNELTASATENIHVSTRKGPWTPVEQDKTLAANHSDLHLTASEPLDQVVFNLRRPADNAAAATVIDRAWVQTWFTSSARQDRAAYQLTTNRPAFEVVLPPGAAAQQALVSVDGKRSDYQRLGSNRLLIPLSSQHKNSHRTIELRYHFPEVQSTRGPLSVELPRFGSKVWVRRLYWQLVLPANEHLLAGDARWTNEFTWDWDHLVLARRPILNQESLETWVGVANRASLPEQANCYLFSTLGNVNEGCVRVAGRTWIVFWASGAALVAGLLLIYMPASRRPASLLIVALALLASGLIAPEPTLLLAQAAVLGLVLTLVAGLLERGTARRRMRIATRKEPSSSRIELGSTHSPYAPISSNSQRSTETMPAVQPQPGETADR